MFKGLSTEVLTDVLTFYSADRLFKYSKATGCLVARRRLADSQSGADGAILVPRKERWERQRQKRPVFPANFAPTLNVVMARCAILLDRSQSRVLPNT